MIHLFLELVLSAATTLRGAARCQHVVNTFFDLKQDVPSWYSGRLWLMRVGYYQLMRAKVVADDWIWILDHTVQIGAEKALLILGIRACHLPPKGQCLEHHHLEPIELLPVTKSNGDIVYEQLEAVAKKMGVPRAILSDHGSDLKNGIDQFCDKHPPTARLYDMAHKVANLLKAQWHKQSRWNDFTALLAQLKNRLQQTHLAHLRPPKQRAKARYMNVGPLVRWAERALFISTHPCQKNETIKTILSPLLEYQTDLVSWGETIELTRVALHFMRTQSLEASSKQQLREYLQRELPTLATSEAQAIQVTLLDYVGEQAQHCGEKERLPISSEVIESVFGKQKRLEGDQASNGLTGLLLALGAIVSTLNATVIKEALTQVSTKMVWDWCHQHLGRSVQAKRQKAFDPPEEEKTEEQKQDQALFA